MRKAILSVSLLAAFGFGILCQPVIFHASRGTAEAAVMMSPEALHLQIDARALPVTQVTNYF